MVDRQRQPATTVNHPLSTGLEEASPSQALPSIASFCLDLYLCLFQLLIRVTWDLFKNTDAPKHQACIPRGSDLIRPEWGSGLGYFISARDEAQVL